MSTFCYSVNSSSSYNCASIESQLYQLNLLRSGSNKSLGCLSQYSKTMTPLCLSCPLLPWPVASVSSRYLSAGASGEGLSWAGGPQLVQHNLIQPHFIRALSGLIILSQLVSQSHTGMRFNPSSPTSFSTHKECADMPSSLSPT